MTTIIVLLSFFAVTEITLVYIRNKTKSYRTKLASIVRIAEFAIFLFLVIAGIIRWSLRYYGLALLLLLLAIKGVYFIYKKREKIAFKSSRVVLKAVGMILLLSLATFPAILFPQYKGLGVTGHYSVAKATYTYIDSDRMEKFNDSGENRKVNVGIWYPQDGKQLYPLIVFSHGGISIKTSNESLYNELASHGYIVASIDHPYHSLYTTNEFGKTVLIDNTYMNELNSEDAKKDPQRSLELYEKWMELRTSDINFVIDHILLQATANSETVYRMIDTDKIAVMGHSLGGAAALLVGRMRDDIAAVMALESPFMGDIIELKDGRFVFRDEAYPVPVLNVYSDSSWNNLSEWPQYGKNHKLLAEDNDTILNVYITGSGHFGLTDLSLTSPILTRIFNGFKSDKGSKDILEIVNKVSLEFYNFYLKHYDAIDIEEIY